MFAYLDPGSGSLLAQLLVAGFAGLAVLARYIWQSFCSRRKSAVEDEPTGLASRSSDPPPDKTHD